jgi:chromosome partitioning protein
VYDLLMGLATPSATITETVVPKLHLMGSTPSLIGAEVELNSMEGKEYRLRRALSGLRDAYDHVFLDCPPSLGFLTVNALTAADAVLVPLQCEYYALEGLSELIRTLKAVKGSLNPSLRLAGLVLTMYDNRNNLSQQVAEELRSHFGASVFETVIPRNVRLSEAPSHGKPVLMYDMQCKGAQSYLALARELIYRGAGKNGKTKGTGEGAVSADSRGTGI